MEWKPDEIKALRKKLELSQREFAKQLGVKRQTVACWESSLRTPSKDCQVKINAVVQPLSPPGEVFRESSRNEVVTSKDYE
jgi:DNA-binding transcriptional regulator YiaG